MRNGLVIVDAGPIFSLATIDNLEILNRLFDAIKIPYAVWKEITLNKKARTIAENLGIKCIGTIGLLSAAKDKKLISELKPLFLLFKFFKITQ